MAWLPIVLILAPAVILGVAGFLIGSSQTNASSYLIVIAILVLVIFLLVRK